MGGCAQPGARNQIRLASALDTAVWSPKCRCRLSPRAERSNYWPSARTKRVPASRPPASRRRLATRRSRRRWPRRNPAPINFHPTWRSKRGAAAGEKIVAYAKEQGWLAKAEGGEASAAPPEEKPARMPPVRPQKKPPQPDAQEKPAEADDPDKNE